MLTQKQEKFAQGIALDGLTQSDAYRSAYDATKMTDKTINEKASLLANKDNIRARIKELRDSLVNSKIMTAQERLEWLTKVIKGEIGEKVLQVVDGKEVEVEMPTSIKNKLSASDQMNKMQGEYTQKIEAEVSNAISINIELSED